jgi:hypothetical protein
MPEWTAMCSICQETLGAKDPKDTAETAPLVAPTTQDKAVIGTACSHYFHETCMDGWVKQQGITTACPDCGTRLYYPRERIPA